MYAARAAGRSKIMYTLKVSYGDVDDEPEMATVDICGTYESRDEAVKAAESKFDAIMERLDDIETRFDAIETSPYRYYVSYGFIELELGYVLDEHYYEVEVIKR